jgi:hypothetical protein
MIYSEFYPNGIIRRQGFTFGNVFFGRWEYYDEQGNLERVVDEDLKFGKIKWTDILDLLEKEGWINRKTGENRVIEIRDMYILPTDGNFYYRLFERPAGIRVGYNPPEQNSDRAGYWGITIPPNFRTDWTKTMYMVDGETGEFEKTEELVAPGW